jgi:hypothetical protein
MIDTIRLDLDRIRIKEPRAVWSLPMTEKIQAFGEFQRTLKKLDTLAEEARKIGLKSGQENWKREVDEESANIRYWKKHIEIQLPYFQLLERVTIRKEAFEKVKMKTHPKDVEEIQKMFEKRSLRDLGVGQSEYLIQIEERLIELERWL